MLDLQRQSLNTYYEKTMLKDGRMADKETHARFLSIRKKITDGMDAFVAEHPETPSVLLKSRLHSRMAERILISSAPALRPVSCCRSGM